MTLQTASTRVQLHRLNAVASPRAALLLWGVVALGLLAAFHTTVSELWSIWSSSAIYSHGTLIPFVAAWLFWRVRHNVLACPPVPALVGLAGFAAAAGLWFAGAVVGVALAQHLALVVMLQTAFAAILGLGATRAAALPLGYLLLAVPVGDVAIPALQDVTAIYTTELLRLTGVPVFKDAWQLVTPDGTFRVARVCAGLQYVLACLAVGVLIAGVFFQRWWTRAIVLGAALVVPVAANVVRAYAIVMIAHLAGFAQATGFAHVAYGFAFLAVVMAVMVVVAVQVRERTQPPTAAARGPGEPAHWPRVGSAAAALAGLAIAARLVAPSGTAADGGVATDLALPDRAPVRAGAPAPFAWQPAFPEAAAHRTWWLSGPDGPVGLFVASYPRPAPGQEFTARNSRLVAQDAAVVARDRAAWRPGEGWPEPLEIRVTPADGPERVIWAWYRVDGHVTVDPIRVKALRLWAELTGRVDRAGVIALAAEGPDPAKRLRGLVDNAHPAALWHAAIGRKTMAANQDEEG